MTEPRPIDCAYEDPLDLVWLRTARELGMRVERSREVFAAWDGAGTLRIAAAEDMDADDSVAQLVFHEICHALVEGPDAWSLPDWGLENRDERHLVREHACHRLQAALADRHGLRRFLAVTTQHRPYYEALGDDPLAADDDAAAEIARGAWERATSGPWSGVVDRALRATAAVASAVGPFADEASLWTRARVVNPASAPSADRSSDPSRATTRPSPRDASR